jgi:hypothetical protein
MEATPPVSAGGAADVRNADDENRIFGTSGAARPDLKNSLTAKFFFALGFHDGAQQAFHREPSDSTAKLRDLAVIRLAKAKRELLDGGAS